MFPPNAANRLACISSRLNAPVPVAVDVDDDGGAIGKIAVAKGMLLVVAVAVVLLLPPSLCPAPENCITHKEIKTTTTITTITKDKKTNQVIPQCVRIPLLLLRLFCRRKMVANR